MTFISIPILSHARRSSADIQQIFEQWQEVRTIHIHEKQEAMAIINCNVGREGPVFHP